MPENALRVGPWRSLRRAMSLRTVATSALETWTQRGQSATSPCSFNDADDHVILFKSGKGPARVKNATWDASF